MSALIAAIGWKPLATALAAVLAMLGLWAKGRRDRAAGAAAERQKQAEAVAKARDIRDQVQNDVGALPGQQARDELSKWSKP